MVIAAKRGSRRIVLARERALLRTVRRDDVYAGTPRRAVNDSPETH